MGNYEYVSIAHIGSSSMMSGSRLLCLKMFFMCLLFARTYCCWSICQGQFSLFRVSPLYVFCERYSDRGGSFGGPNA